MYNEKEMGYQLVGNTGFTDIKKQPMKEFDNCT